MFYFLYGALAAHTYNKTTVGLPDTDGKVHTPTNVDNKPGSYYGSEVAMTRPQDTVPVDDKAYLANVRDRA